MIHHLTNENLKKLHRILSIKKRVQKYRLTILIILFLVVIPLIYFTLIEHTTNNRNWFIGLSALGLFLILRSRFGQLATFNRVEHIFITDIDNEENLLEVTTADGVMHRFPKQSTNFKIETGTPFYWGDLYGSLFSPTFFEYDWSTPEKSIYQMHLNNEHYVLQPSLFEDYNDLALDMIDVAKTCRTV